MRSLRSTTIIALLLSPLKLPAEPPVDSLIIHVVETSNRSDLQVHYFLTGDFGGVGEDRVEPFGENGLLISTQYQQKKAKTLRAVLYSPGCALQLVRVENLQTDPREVEFVCYPLASIKMQGQIDMTAIPYSRDLKVHARYVAGWSHPFFGIADGIVMTLDAGTASVEPDGTFVIELPGFAADPISSNIGSDAYFSLMISRKTTWNLASNLEAETPLRATPNGDLKLERAYTAPVRFFARPMN